MHPRLTTAIVSSGLVSASLALAPAASAHDALTGSVPSANATLTSAPEKVTLTFDAPVLALDSQVVVKAPNGATASGKTNVKGTTVSTPFSAAGNGAYTVTWRATSSDGHPISGSYSFTLKANGVNGASSAAGGQLGAAGPESPSPTSVTGPSTPTTNEPGDNQPILVIGGAVLAAAALAGAFVVARRRVRDDAR